MINTVRQLMHNIRLFCGTQCSAASSWRQARTKIFRTTDEADTVHLVSELPTARKLWLYLFSRIRSNRHITCVQCEHATLLILNHMPQTFSLLPVFRHVLSKGASKAKIATYQYCYKFWLWIFFFCNLFVQNFFYQNFFPKFFLSKLFPKFFS